MGDEDRRVPSNQDLYELLQRFEANVGERLDAMDHKIDEHRRYVEGTFVTVSAADGLTKEITKQVIREVTKESRNLVMDAVKSAAAEIQHNAREDFKRWYVEQVAEDRRERRERLATIIAGVKSTGAMFLMLAAIVNIVIAWWLMTH